MKKFVVIPLVAGALGTTKTKFEKCKKSIGIEIRSKHDQKSVLLGTATINKKGFILLSTQERILQRDL